MTQYLRLRAQAPWDKTIKSIVIYTRLHTNSMRLHTRKRLSAARRRVTLDSTNSMRLRAQAQGLILCEA